VSHAGGAAHEDGRHYSYSHYADEAVASGFDALRFGGPIGRYLLETQARIESEAFAPLAGRTIADVGTGTGRAAIGLAQGGARLIGLDASQPMLRVARARAAEAGVPFPVWAADAHRLPLPTGAVDGAVSLRVLMHAVDWHRCVAELCRVARWRVAVDFPAVRSAAAVESATRRVAAALGRRTEPYRVLAERDVRAAFESHGFSIVRVERQFVLPIALHKKVGSLGLTRGAESVLRRVGLLRLFGSPITLIAERRAGSR
jgi:ubiquinone/menaquinone biosynthesis C-methylase UbiE